MTEEAILAGGCFWCLEAVFDDLKGVEEVESGYIGGGVENPTYREVCSGTTGHAEAVRIRFRPEEIGFRDLLQIFFTIHDPTTLNRQGGDVGTQYRSAIFPRDQHQRATAQEVMVELEGKGVWGRPLVTRLEEAQTFYPAEEEHRDYYRRNPGQGYCRLVIEPKVTKARRLFLDRFRDG